MQVFCNVGTQPVEKKSKGGKIYYEFRAGENNGQNNENKSTTWYNVKAFINEVDGDLLNKGMFVKITGKLSVEAFQKRDGTWDAAALIMAFSVEPIEKKVKTDGEPA